MSCTDPVIRGSSFSEGVLFFLGGGGVGVVYVTVWMRLFTPPKRTLWTCSLRTHVQYSVHILPQLIVNFLTTLIFFIPSLQYTYRATSNFFVAIHEGTASIPAMYREEKTANWSFVKTVDIFLLSIFSSLLCADWSLSYQISRPDSRILVHLSVLLLYPPPPPPNGMWVVLRGGGGDRKKQQQDATLQYVFLPTKNYMYFWRARLNISLTIAMPPILVDKRFELTAAKRATKFANHL